jgi:heavy metal efflux system protein
MPEHQTAPVILTLWVKRFAPKSQSQLPGLIIVLILLINMFPGGVSVSQSISLEEAYAAVNEKHPDIMHALAQVRIADGQKLLALSPPPLSLSYFEEDIATDNSFGDGGQRVYSIGQTFDIPLLIGARGYLYGALSDAAKANVQYAERKARGEALRSYSLLFARHEQVLLLRRNASNAKRMSEIASERYEAGETSKLAALQARTRHALAEQLLRKALIEEEAASRGLATAMGIGSSGTLLATDSLVVHPENTFHNPDMTAQIASHPLHAASTLRMEGFHSDKTWRWLEYLPSFSASAFRQEYRDLGNYWGLELTAHIPLWGFLMPRGSTEQAAGNLMEAEARYSRMHNMIAVRLANVQSRYIHMRTTITEYSTSLLAEGNEIQRVANLAYASGDISFLEYSMAIENANEILIGYFDVLADYYDAIANYETETGIVIQR